MIPARAQAAHDSSGMKTFPLFLAGLVGLSVSNLLAVDPPSPEAEKFLIPYEQVLKALVQEDLPAAKQAAHALPDNAGNDIENAKDLKAARDAFHKTSETAEKMAAGVPGYHVFYCPMTKGNWTWVQQTTAIANPYMGKDMLTCGVEKK